MLISFSTRNYLSFKDKATLRFAHQPRLKDQNASELITWKNRRYIPSLVLYGANSSGKSNIIKAFGFMRRFIQNSSKEGQANEKIPVHPFLLHTDTEKSPSFFEAIFQIENYRYRYGFEVDAQKIHREWLLYAYAQKEYPLFLRESETIEWMKGFEEGEKLEAKTRPNALFLSVVAQFNGIVAGKLLEWFSNMHVVSGLEVEHFEGLSVSMYQNEDWHQRFIHFLNDADLGFAQLRVNEYRVSEDNLPDNLPGDLKKKLLEEEATGYNIQTTHPQYNHKDELVRQVNFPFEELESEGTKKFFRLTGLFLQTLAYGGLLVIDEMDARLHPLLSNKLIRLFHDKTTNPKGAQLILTTHDTNLLSSVNFRREQIWFVEKDHYQASHLYSLASYKREKGQKVRNDEAYEKNYIRGRYGAIPYLGDFQSIIETSEYSRERENQ